MCSRLSNAVFIAVVSSFAVVVMHGAQITALVPLVSPGGAVLAGGFATPALNNDEYPGPMDVLPNPTVLILEKEFTALDFVDLLVQVRDSGGVTDYDVDEDVLNSTGLTWYDYHHRLGFLVNGVFVPVNPLSDLDFDTPHRNPRPDSTRMVLALHNPNRLDWLAPNAVNRVPNGAAVGFFHSLDIPDFNGFYMPEEVYNPMTRTWSFVLRQAPTVPEPGTLRLTAIAGVVIAGGALLRRRRQRMCRKIIRNSQRARFAARFAP
jgi:hypothetical protein